MKKIQLLILVLILAIIPTVMAETLLYDGFETGIIDTHWNNSGGVTSNWTIELTPSQGNYNIRASDTDAPAYFTIYIDTHDYRDIVLQLDYYLQGTDSDDYFHIEWYDGSNWNTLLNTYTQNGGYTTVTYDLPASAYYNTNFGIRFVANSNNANDIIRVDEVLVTGTYNGELLPNSLLGIMIIVGLFLVTYVFVALTVHFDNEMKFVFFIMIFLSVALNLRVMTMLGDSSGLSAEIIHLLELMYKVSIWLVLFIFMYSMVKITGALRVKKKDPAFLEQPRLNEEMNDKLN